MYHEDSTVVSSFHRNLICLRSSIDEWKQHLRGVEYALS